MYIENINQIDYSKLNRTVDLIIPAQSAKLSPPVGSTLGQVKIKVKDFCSSFNERSLIYPIGLPLRVMVFVYKNESFDYIIKSPSTTFLIKNIISLNKKKELSLVDIYKIMCIKKLDSNYILDKLIFRNILILAKIMKIQIKLD